MKYALYAVLGGEVIQWQDHEMFRFAPAPAGTALFQLPDDFEFPDSPRWVFDDALTDVEPPAPAQPESGPIVPSSVTMRQARLALLAAGKLQAVSDAIDALPSPQKEASQIEWEYAQTVDRDSAFTQSLATALGLTETDLDSLFQAAAEL